MRALHTPSGGPSHQLGVQKTGVVIVDAGGGRQLGAVGQADTSREVHLTALDRQGRSHCMYVLRRRALTAAVDTRDDPAIGQSSCAQILKEDRRALYREGCRGVRGDPSPLAWSGVGLERRFRL
jgi:hypothetical protein